MFRQNALRRITFPVILAIVSLSFTDFARAERPSTMKLFPEESVVFVRMANAQNFGDKFNETATGRMLRDPQLKPFVEQLWGDVGNMYAEDAEEKLGISWEDLKNLPKGEVAFAVVARP